MQRPSGTVLACALMAWSLCSSPAQAQDAGAQPAQQQPAQQAQPAQQQAAEQKAPEKLTFTGDAVLWAFTVNPDKAADYDQVIAKLKEALVMHGTPETQAQLAGWRVLRNDAPQPDGSLLYIHVINPVVKGADYSISNIVFGAFKAYEEQQKFYELYKGAVKAPFFLIQGPIVADLGK